MTDEWQPDEATIQKILDRFTPREVAIAYLRAKRQAKASNLAFNMMANLSDGIVSAVQGDGPATIEALERVNKDLRTADQIMENPNG